MIRNRKVKIIATLGPVTETEEEISKLFEAGADVFRLNFSHADHDTHKSRYETIRKLEKKYNRPIAILADLQGPKLRVGQFKNGEALLSEGEIFRFDLDDALGTDKRVNLPHPQIFEAIEVGTELLIDDGRLKLVVEEFGDDWAEARVVVGGKISDRKGVNVPNAILNISALTKKDRADLKFALELGVDWIALSFVQKPEDVIEAKEIIGGRAAVISKLEKPSAIDYLDEIIKYTDAVMVARGDLGVEVPAQKVPEIQKRIIRKCRRAGKPVAVATQMLDSMISAPVPTRAEASDVANAVYDGADAVMLSGETTIGQYPFETVSMMSSIITEVEADPYYSRINDTFGVTPDRNIGDAVAAASAKIASVFDIKTIVSFTESGATTLRVARERPNMRIISASSSIETARMLCLVWGVHTAVIDPVKQFAEIVNLAEDYVKDNDFAKVGEHILTIAGVPVGVPGSTNSLRITKIS